MNSEKKAIHQKVLILLYNLNTLHRKLLTKVSKPPKNASFVVLS